MGEHLRRDQAGAAEQAVKSGGGEGGERERERDLLFLFSSSSFGVLSGEFFQQQKKRLSFLVYEIIFSASSTLFSSASLPPKAERNAFRV